MGVDYTRRGPRQVGASLASAATDPRPNACASLVEWAASEMTFNELVRRLEQGGFRIVREKGSVRYYCKPGWYKLKAVHDGYLSGDAKFWIARENATRLSQINLVSAGTFVPCNYSAIPLSR